MTIGKPFLVVLFAWIFLCVFGRHVALASDHASAFGALKIASDFERVSSLHYPASIPSGGIFDSLGRMVAMQGELAIAADSGAMHDLSTFHFERSDRLIVFRKVDGIWQVSGQVRPYWERGKRLKLSSIGISDGRVVVLGLVEDLFGENRHVLETYVDGENGWSWQNGIDFGPVSNQTARPEIMRVSGQRAFVAMRADSVLSVRVFELGPTGPTEIGSTGAIAELQGSQIQSLDVEGDQMAIGALDFSFGNSNGKVVMLKSEGPNWIEDGVLRDDDQQINDWFGYRVDLLGSLLAVSSPRRVTVGDKLGTLTIFARSGDGWSRQSVVLPPSTFEPGSVFGQCLDFSGSTLLACNSTAYSSQHLFQYRVDNGIVSSTPELSFRPNGVPTALNGIGGINVVSRDGSEIFAGYASLTVNFARYQGAVFFLESLDAGAVGPHWKWLGPNREEYSFGYDVSAGTDWLAVGVPFRKGVRNFESTVQGAVRLYRRAGAHWDFHSELVTSNYEYGFGATSRLRGQEMVTASGSSTQSPPRVNLHRFRLSSGVWSLYRSESFLASDGRLLFRLEDDFIAIYQQDRPKLSIRRPDDPWSVWAEFETDNFSYLEFSTLATSSTYIAVTASDELGGYVQIFDRIGDQWTEGAKLRSPAPGFVDSFGRRMSANSRGLLISEHGSGAASNPVFYFPRSAAGWGEGEQLAISSDDVTWQFGSALLLQGDRALVGSAFCQSLTLCSEIPIVAVYERGPDGWVRKDSVATSDRPGSVESIASFGTELLVGMPFSDPLNEMAVAAGEVAILASTSQDQLVFEDGFEASR